MIAGLFRKALLLLIAVGAAMGPVMSISQAAQMASAMQAMDEMDGAAMAACERHSCACADGCADMDYSHCMLSCAASCVTHCVASVPVLSELIVQLRSTSTVSRSSLRVGIGVPIDPYPPRPSIIL